MEVEKIKNELEKKKARLKVKILIIGVTNAANILNINISDISNWLHNKREWSYKKVIKMTEILNKKKPSKN